MSDEDFNTWMTFLTDRVEAFEDTLNPWMRQRVDFSPDSLLVVCASSEAEGGAAHDGS